MNRTLIGPSYGWIGARHALCDGRVTLCDELPSSRGEVRDEMQATESPALTDDSAIRGFEAEDSGMSDRGSVISDERFRACGLMAAFQDAIGHRRLARDQCGRHCRRCRSA